MRLMRAGVVLLAVAGILGAAAELASARHWSEPIQFVPWVALGVLTLALLLLATARGRRGRLAVVRVLALGVMAASAYGVFVHIASNRDAGALDARFAATWDQLPAATQWWYAASMTVGPAPPLAAGVLGYAAALVLLATIGLRRRPAPADSDATVATGD